VAPVATTTSMLISPRTFPAAVSLHLPDEVDTRRRSSGSPNPVYPTFPASGGANSNSARKVRESVRKELAQHRWQELRTELLAARMPSLLRAASAPPLISLVMAFCRNVRLDTYSRALVLERSIRASVTRAETRARGLESLGYLMRHAPAEYKAAALLQWSATVQEWSPPRRAAGASNAPSALVQALCTPGASTSATGLVPFSSCTPFSTPLRFDYLLHACGAPLLHQVQEAFFAGLGANLGLIHRAMQQLRLDGGVNVGGEDDMLSGGTMQYLEPYTALQRVRRLRAGQGVHQSQQQGDVLRSPGFAPFGASHTGYTGSFHSSFSSLSLDASECLSLLSLALNGWFVSFFATDGSVGNIEDKAFLRGAQVARTVVDIARAFNELDDEEEEAQEEEKASDAGAAERGALQAYESDRLRCRAIGRQSRRLFRLLAFAALLGSSSPSTATSEDDAQKALDAAKEEAAAAAAAGPTSASATGSPLDAAGLPADGFEASILHLLFSRLEEILEYRLCAPGESEQGSPSGETQSFVHPQDERDCFDAITMLLLACANTHVKLALTHHADEAVSTPPSPHANGGAAGSDASSLSSRCFQLLSQLLHPSIFPRLSMRVQRRAIGLANALLPLVTPAVVELLWNQEEDVVAEEVLGADTDMASAAGEASLDSAASTAMDVSVDDEAAALSHAAMPLGELGVSVSPMPPTSSNTSRTAPSQLVSYLLLSIGYYSCGQFLEVSSEGDGGGDIAFPHSQERCAQLVSELVGLVRNLLRSKHWLLSVSASLAGAMQHLRHGVLDAGNHSEREGFYAAFAAVLVYGAFVEPLRVGGRVLIHRVAPRAEKLSQREAALSGSSATLEDAASGVDTSHGTVVGFDGAQVLVVHDGDATQRLHLLPRSTCTPLPRYPCTQPFHLHGEEGVANTRALVRFLLDSFSGHGDVNNGFNLFAPVPPAVATSPPEVRAVLRAQYVQSQLKLHAMRALTHCLSLVLTRPELVAESVRLYGAAMTLSGQPEAAQVNNTEVLVQCIVKEVAEAAPPEQVVSPKAGQKLPLLSNLLALAQQIIPLSSGLGKLDELEAKAQLLHTMLHDATSAASATPALATPVPASVRHGVHADLFVRGMQIHLGDPVAAASWARRKQNEHRDAGESRRRASEKLSAAQLKPLTDLGFDEALCKRALLLHNGDTAQSVHWLTESGFAETDALRRGQVHREVWGLEGVDFYQEKGHWVPCVALAAEEDAAAAASKNAKAAEKGDAGRSASKARKDRKAGDLGREPPQEHLSVRLEPIARVPSPTPSPSSSSDRRGRDVSTGGSGSLPHPPPPMDPYRRLALYTAPQMAAQALRSEAVHHELTGRPPLTVAHEQVAGVKPGDESAWRGWSLLPTDVRPGVGQRLRVSRGWVARHRSLLAPSATSASLSFRWYFLTEDNHWAPLDAADMAKLDLAYSQGHSAVWLGLEEKTPALVRLDKMCMYNELTGHARPLRRKAMEANPLVEPPPPAPAQPVTSVAQAAPQAQAQEAPAAASSSAPVASPFLFDTLSSDRRALAEALSGMGFPREWCALALSHTGFHGERAADWLLTEGNVALCEAHDKAVAAKQEAAAKLQAANAAAAAAAAALTAGSDAAMRDAASDAGGLSKKQKLSHESSPSLSPLLDPSLSPSPSPLPAMFSQSMSMNMGLMSPSLMVPRVFVPKGVLAKEDVNWNLVHGLAGRLGTVVAVSKAFHAPPGRDRDGRAKDDVPERKVLLEWRDEEVQRVRRAWVPLDALEWDTQQVAEAWPDYAQLHNMQFVTSPSASHTKRVTHSMQTQLAALQAQLESFHAGDGGSAAPASQPANSLFNLAVDVSTSLCIVHSRRLVLLLLYILSLPSSVAPGVSSGSGANSGRSSPLPSPRSQGGMAMGALAMPYASMLAVPAALSGGGSSSASSSGRGLSGLIQNLSASALVKILKLASLDSPATAASAGTGVGLDIVGGIGGASSEALELTFPIEDGSTRGVAVGEASFGATSAEDETVMPPTPGLVTRNSLDVDWNALLHSDAESESASVALPPAPRSISLWLVLSTLLHNPSPLFSSPAREQLFSLLLEDVKKTLLGSSLFVRDIDTEHPYQSGVHEGPAEIVVEHAASLLVTFDRRCNLNQSHALLAFYADKACTQELGVFSGSADEGFSHVLVPGERFYYKFDSGALRQKPYEFGFRFRVRPLGFRMPTEAAALAPTSPALASAMQLGLPVPSAPPLLAGGAVQSLSVGPSNPTPISGAPVVKPYAFSFSLGWPLLVMLTDSPLLIDRVLCHALALDTLQALLKYLTVCRSPCKVLVTRALSALCVRVRQSGPQQGNYEILLRVMEQLYESNTASGWGSSPFLCALVDLARVRPQPFKLGGEVWGVDTLDGRPANWFFLAVLRAEELGRAVLQSKRLPHVRVAERAQAELSDLEILRWSLKQPELCLKLHKQVRGWNQSRRDWMGTINTFTRMDQASSVLIVLRDSLLPECFRYAAWVPSTIVEANGHTLTRPGPAMLDWERRVSGVSSVAQVAALYMELEASLKWGDTFPEAERAFGDTWASRRGDWLAAMKGLAEGRVVPVASTSEAMEARWTRAMDEALVAHVDALSNKKARRLMSLTYRDIEPLSAADLMSAPSGSGPHPLRHVSIEHLRARFGILKLLSTDFMRLLPVVDLRFHRVSWSLSSLAKQVAKGLLFAQSKMYLWRSMLGRLYSEERPQFVILNRHAAAKKRASVASKLQHSLFYQLFSSIGLQSDPSGLRRRGQAWMVKFVGEGGHDVGGMYNESLVEVCNELQSERASDGGAGEDTEGAAGAGGAASAAAAGEGASGASGSEQLLLPLFRLCPNGHHVVGDHRGSYLPNPCATRPLHLAMLEFVGRMLGVCTLDNNRALPLAMPSLVWKAMVAEPLSLADLKQFDFHSWNLLQRMRHPNGGSGSGSDGVQVNADTFEYLFPDLTFSVEVEVEEYCATGGGSGGVDPVAAAFDAATAAAPSGTLVRRKRVVDLLPNGRHIPVTFSRSSEYAALLERFYLTRYSRQLHALARGISSVVPAEFLAMFTSAQLEALVTGSAVMDVQLLRDKTEYRGNVSAQDKHIQMFWAVMEEFNQEQRKNFLQFVWGRRNLPSSALGFGKDLFKISDHAAALQTGVHDHYLPVAHTCFFALELPRYSSQALLSAKLLYAISNCSSIDGDATHEGRANMMMAWEEDDD